MKLVPAGAERVARFILSRVGGLGGREALDLVCGERMIERGGPATLIATN